jgi:hypothetical protein
MIAIFATACPVGWTRVAGWDGRYLRAAATYGAIGGAYNHGHGLGTMAAASHAHTISLSGPKHTHAFGVSGNTGGGGGHSHPYSGSVNGTTGANSAGNMNVDAGSSGNMARGDHTHNVSIGFSGNTDFQNDHTHGFSGSGTTGDGGDGAITGNTGAAAPALTGAMDVVDHQPPFIDVVYCQKN